jgi:predicted nucleic acid-binding protein
MRRILRRAAYRRERIYVDTSVIGGCCDPEFREWSNALLRDFRRGAYVLLVSELVAAEIADAPDEIQAVYARFLESPYNKILPIIPEALDLAGKYLQQKIVTPKYSDDALHIALATTAGADMVVSWNFRHIVHFDKIRAFNAANQAAGMKQIMIHSPREVAKNG